MPASQESVILQTNKNCEKSKRFLVYYIERKTDFNLPMKKQKQSNNNQVCQLCGSPYIKNSYEDKQECKEEELLSQKPQMHYCILCQRDKWGNILLITLYVLSVLFFIACLVAVIFDQLGFDITLMIGCLQIIFLYFFGRYLEELIFLGIPEQEKVIGAFYRYGINADLQIYEIAIKFLRKSDPKKYLKEFYKSLFLMLLYQSDQVPFNFYQQMSDNLDVSLKTFLRGLRKANPYHSLEQMNNQLPREVPAKGYSFLAQLAVFDKSDELMSIVSEKLKIVFETPKTEDNWLREFLIYSKYYRQILSDLPTSDLLIQFDNLLSATTFSKVPTMDVISEGKNIIQKSPLLRYIVRILFYMLLAFLLGLLFRIFD